MAEDFGIVVKVDAVLSDAEDKIQGLINKYNNTPIRLKVDTTEVQRLTKEVEKAATAIQKTMGSRGAVNFGNIGIDTSKMQVATRTMNEIVSTANKLGSAFADVNAQTQKVSVSKVIGTENVRGMVEMQNEIGKTTNAILLLNEVTGEVQSASVRFTENFAKQQEAARKLGLDVEKLANDYKKFYSDAFKRDNPLDASLTTDAKTAGAIDNLQARYTLLFETISSGAIKSREDFHNFQVALANMKIEAGDLQKALYPGNKLTSQTADSIASGWDVKITEKVAELEKAGLYVDEFKTKIQELRDAIPQAISSGSFQGIRSMFASLEADITRFSNSTEGIGLKLRQSLMNGISNNALPQINEWLNNPRIAGATTTGLTEIRDGLTSLQSEYTRIFSEMSTADVGSERFKELQAELKRTGTEFESMGKQMKLVQDNSKWDIKTEGINKLTVDLQNLEAKYGDIIRKSPELQSSIEEFKQKLSTADASQLEKLRTEFSTLSAGVRTASNEAGNFGQIFRSSFGSVGAMIASYVSMTRILMKGIQAFKSMVNSVREFDSSLVELQKVTHLSGDELDSFVDKAFEVGNALGRTGKDVTDAVTTFSRAGYDMQEAMNLAQSALVMTNIGADISSADEAASHMISILKAYGVEAENSMDVIDKLYNVSNLEPIDFGNITQGLVTVGGTLAQTGTTIEQSIAMITGGFATMRDVGKVSNGLIMISQRLRGINEDGEAIDGLAPKLQGEFESIGISLQDSNGELRSTYDVLNDLAKVWGTLSSKQRQMIGEDVAGNRQVKILNAMMQNWDVVQNSMADAANAAGTAMEGNELFAQSIEGRINKLKSSIQELAQATIDSDFIKFWVDAARGVVEFTTKIGGLQNVLLPLLGVFTAMKFDGVVKAFGAITISVQHFGAALKANLPVLLALIAAYGALKALDYQSQSQQRFESAVTAYKDEFASRESNVKSLNEQLDETRALMADLEGRKLSPIEQEEYVRLQATTAQLEQQLEIEKQLAELARQNAINAGVEAVENKGKRTSDYNHWWEAVIGRTPFGENEEYIAKNWMGGFVGASNVDWLNGAIGKGALRPGNMEYADYVQAARLSLPNLRTAIQQMEESILAAGDNVQQWQLDHYSDLQGYFVDAASIVQEYADYVFSTFGEEVFATTTDHPVLTNQEKEANEAIRQAKKDRAAILGTKSAQFDYIRAEYAEELSDMMEQVSKEADMANVDWTALLDGFPTIKDALRGFGWTDRQIEDQFKAFASTSVVSKEQEADAATVSLTGKYSELKDELYSTTSAYEALSKAISEQNSTGRLSAETFASLIAQDKEYGQFLETTAGGYRLNTEALYDYLKAQDKLEQGKAIARIQDIQEALAAGNLTPTEQLDLTNEMHALEMYVLEIDRATGAWARLEAAKKSANADAGYQAQGKLYEEFSEMRKSGKVGTDDFDAMIAYALGEGWEEAYGGDWQQAAKDAEAIFKRYGTGEEQKDLNRFIDDLVKAGAARQTENGFELTGMTIEEIASALGISSELTTNMFGLASTYTRDFEMPVSITAEGEKLAEQAKQIEQWQKEVEEYNNTLEQLQAKKATPGLSESELADIDKQIEQVTALRDARQALIDNSDIMPETTEGKDSLQKSIEIVRELLETNGENVEIPISLGGQYEELKQLIEILTGRKIEGKIDVEAPEGVGAETSASGQGDTVGGVLADGLTRAAGDLSNAAADLSGASVDVKGVALGNNGTGADNGLPGASNNTAAQGRGGAVGSTGTKSAAGLPNISSATGNAGYTSTSGIDVSVGTVNGNVAAAAEATKEAASTVEGLASNISRVVGSNNGGLVDKPEGVSVIPSGNATGNIVTGQSGSPKGEPSSNAVNEAVEYAADVAGDALFTSASDAIAEGIKRGVAEGKDGAEIASDLREQAHDAFEYPVHTKAPTDNAPNQDVFSGKTNPIVENAIATIGAIESLYANGFDVENTNSFQQTFEGALQNIYDAGEKYAYDSWSAFLDHLKEDVGVTPGNTELPTGEEYDRLLEEAKESANEALDKLPEIDTTESTAALEGSLNNVITDASEQVSQIEPWPEANYESDYQPHEPDGYDDFWGSNGVLAGMQNDAVQAADEVYTTGIDTTEATSALETGVNAAVENAAEQIANEPFDINEVFRSAMGILNTNGILGKADKASAEKALSGFFNQGGTVDLTKRPVIPSDWLADAGYDVERGGIATTFSSGFTAGVFGHIGIVCTPILPNGDVLEPDTFEDAVAQLIVGEDGKIVPESDEFGIVLSSMDLSGMTEEQRSAYLDQYGEMLHEVQEVFYQDAPVIDSIIRDTEPEITPKINTEGLQENTQESLAETTVEVPAHIQPEGVEDTEATQQEVEIPAEVKVDDDGIQEVRNAANELLALDGFQNWNLDAGLADAAQNLIAAYNNLQSLSPADTGYAAAAADLEAAAANFNTAYQSLASAVGMPKSVRVTADVSSANRAINNLSNRTVTVTVVTNEIRNVSTNISTNIVPNSRNMYASGTKNATGGLSLVDERGAELIEHTKTGTYELGTNKGARLVALDPGDVVHTASETKSILSRMASKVGGAFASGKTVTNSSKSKTSSATSILNSIKKAVTSVANKVVNTVKSATKQATNKTITQTPKGVLQKAGTSGSKSSGSGGKSSGSGKSSGGGGGGGGGGGSAKSQTDELKDYLSSLFDWVEVKLDRLDRQTQQWINDAAQAIGYVTRNSYLDKAISATQDQIEAANQAFARYQQQADAVAAKVGLSADIYNKIKDGTIDISQYDETTRTKISGVKEWYDKALDARDSIAELQESITKLATEKLDNVLDYYDYRVNRLDAVVDLVNSKLDLKRAKGIEIFANEYDDAISSTSEKINELIATHDTLLNEFNSVVNAGYVKQGSKEWDKYKSELEKLESQINNTGEALQDLIDEAAKIPLTNLQYAMDALKNLQDSRQNWMSLHDAQDNANTAQDYEYLIQNGMEQIENLRAQNEELRKQQEGLDVLSEKYQDLQKDINNNEAAILKMMTQQEKWNDAVLDLEIDRLEKYKDSLDKVNDAYEKQKQLQEALEQLEKARRQRTIRVYREGVGFVYEADQEAIRAAQENLDEVLHDQTMDKIDEIIDAIDSLKEDTDVYDAEGNLLGQPYSLPSITDYQDLLSTYGANTILNNAIEDAKNAAYQQVMSGINNNNNSTIQIGDIIVNGAEDVNALVQAIQQEFPMALLQAIHGN